MRIMQQSTIFMIVGAMALVLALGIVAYHPSIPSSLNQYCGYYLNIYTNDPMYGAVRINYSDNPIRNITLYIPLPHRNGKPLVLNEELTPALFEKYSIERLPGNATSPHERPPPLNYTIVSVNGTQMIQIKGDPGSTLKNFMMKFDETKDFGDNLTVHELQKTVNTLTPLGNSSVFVPKDGCVPAPAAPSSRSHELSCTYTLPVFVSYDTDPNTTLKIDSSFGCYNYWYEGFRWPSNTYGDHFELNLKGPAHGWYLANGTLTAGEGIYR